MTDVVPAIGELRAIPQWLAWRREKKDGKPTKVPYIANNGSYASSTDPKTWMAYAKAEAAFKKAGHDGLGWAVTPPYCGIDMDHCRDPQTGVIKPWAMEIVKGLDSYTEITPSGEGLRVWIRGQKTGTGCKKSMGSNGQKIEIYDHDRYFTVTENHLAGTPDTINERQEELTAVEQKTFGAVALAAQVHVASSAAPAPVVPSISAQQVIDLMKKAKNWPEIERLMDGDISKYNDDDSSADAALCCYTAWYTHDPEVIDQVMRMGKLGERDKWKTRADYRKRTIDRAIATVAVGYQAVAIAPTLPNEFWNARLSLRTIRRAAHSRGRSADAVLGAYLTRVSAGVPHPLRIPAIVGTAVPLCLFAIVIARSGIGKSSSYGVAVELHPLDPPSVDDPSKIKVADRLPIGSGEGLVEVLFDTRSEKDDAGKTKDVKYQALYNAAFYVDEGSVLAALGNRAGSVLLPTLRTVFTGGPLGQTNASKERRRIVPAGHYAIGVCVAFQPESAGAFLEDEAAGTPQRFLWFSAIDPAIPIDLPPWPSDALPLKLADFFGIRDGGPRDMIVVDSIRNEVRAADGARNRGEVVAESLQAHADLLRLKVAALLAILDGRLDVNDEDWRLAGMIKATSDGVLAHVQEHVRQAAARKESATSQRLGRRQVEAVAMVDQHRIEECAERIRKKVKDRPGVTVKEVREAMPASLRDVFEDGLEYALAQKRVIEKNETVRGGTKRSLYPGPRLNDE